MPHQRFFIVPGVLLGAALLTMSADSAALYPQEKTPGRAIQQLISEVDLSCSFFLAEAPPSLRIAAPARDNEKSVLSDFDEFYVDAGGMEFPRDQAWQIVESGPVFRAGGEGGAAGTVVFKRGRARFVRREGEKALFRVEKACGPIMVGSGLVPFIESPTLRGEVLPWEGPFQGGDVLTGRVVFLDNDLVQLSAGLWALIDLGTEHGLAVGRQLTVFHKEGEAVPPQAVGTVIVIDAGGRWATIKALGSRDAIRLGDLVQVK